MKKEAVLPQTVYSLWDVASPELPPRSRLYHLAPIGVGTAAVESLTSYIARLAAAHQVETGTLFAREVVPLINTAYLFKAGNEPISYALHLIKDIHALNGCGPTVAAWVSALQTLTRRDNLRLLTMLPWRNVLTLRSLMRTTRAWCPDCLEESSLTHEPVYDRLIWTLEMVSICTRHQRPLVEHCPHCQSSSLVLTPHTRPGHCFRCHCWLGEVAPCGTHIHAHLNDNHRQQLLRVTLIGELLTLVSTLPTPISPGIFAAQLCRYIEQLTRGNAAAFARLLGLDYLLVRGWRHGANRPTLELFITLIERLRLSVQDFFSGRPTTVEPPDQQALSTPRQRAAARVLIQSSLADPARPSLSELAGRLGYKLEATLRQADPTSCKELSARHRQVREYDHRAHLRRYDEPALRERLTAALQEDPAPPLQRLAERLGYKYAQTLRIRCPDLYSALVERRHTYLQEQAAWWEEQLQAALQEEPPPALRTIGLRLGLNAEGSLKEHFPELVQAVIDRRKGWIKEGTMQIKGLLETALTQTPAPSIRQIARQAKRSISTLYRHHYDLCRQVAARRLTEQSQRVEKKRNRRKEEIRQTVQLLIAQGLSPSLYRVSLAAARSNIVRADWAKELYLEVLNEMKVAFPSKHT